MSEIKFYPYFVFATCFLGVTLGAMNSVLAPSYLPDILKDFHQGPLSSENAGAWINFSFNRCNFRIIGLVSFQIG